MRFETFVLLQLCKSKFVIYVGVIESEMRESVYISATVVKSLSLDVNVMSKLYRNVPHKLSTWYASVEYTLEFTFYCGPVEPFLPAFKPLTEPDLRTCVVVFGRTTSRVGVLIGTSSAVARSAACRECVPDERPAVE